MLASRSRQRSEVCSPCAWLGRLINVHNYGQNIQQAIVMVGPVLMLVDPRTCIGLADDPDTHTKYYASSCTLWAMHTPAATVAPHVAQMATLRCQFWYRRHREAWASSASECAQLRSVQDSRHGAVLSESALVWAHVSVQRAQGPCSQQHTGCNLGRSTDIWRHSILSTLCIEHLWRAILQTQAYGAQCIQGNVCRAGLVVTTGAMGNANYVLADLDAKIAVSTLEYGEYSSKFI
jgi:hypothetical protein